MNKSIKSRDKKRPRRFVAALIVAAFASGFAGSATAPASPWHMGDSCVIEAEFLPAVSDMRFIAGNSDDIFVGKVIGQSGTRVKRTGPQTQFNVKVLETLKGDVTGQMVVNQDGGVKDGSLCLVNKDPLLSVGAAYLFSTTHGPGTTWYPIIAPGYGDIKLSPEEEKNVTAGPPSPEPQVVVKMRSAIKHQMEPIPR
jgi:hypothetical protein